MNDKEKLIIGKLLKIAENQQKILQRLAQTQVHDPIIDYINNRLIAVVAANMHIPNVLANTTKQEGAGPMAGSNMDYSPKLPDQYYSHITGVPLQQQSAFSKATMTQLKMQKPEVTLTLFF